MIFIDVPAAETTLPWYQIVVLLFGGAGITGIFMFLLKWIRFRRNDSATINKSDAETEKIKAEAYQVKATADIGIADAALKLAQRLGEDVQTHKKQLEKTQEDLSNAMNSLRDASIQLHEVQHELNNERQKNALLEKELDELKIEIELLRSGQKKPE